MATAHSSSLLQDVVNYLAAVSLNSRGVASSGNSALHVGDALRLDECDLVEVLVPLQRPSKDLRRLCAAEQ